MCALLCGIACCTGRGPDWQFIDLLPTNAGKGSAMRYIQHQLGFGDDSTVASGDAMNDLLMLQQVRIDSQLTFFGLRVLGRVCFTRVQQPGLIDSLVHWRCGSTRKHRLQHGRASCTQI
jgi:hypothetical protein